MEVTAGELGKLIDGEVDGDADVKVSGPSRIEESVTGNITFLANARYESHIYLTQASVILVDQDFQPSHEVPATLIRVDNVYEALAKVIEHFDQQYATEIGISAQAQIHPSAQIGEGVYISDFVVIDAHAEIGDHVKVESFVYIGKGSTIGAETHLYSGVKIYHGCVIGDRVKVHANTVIGSDGFGFARSNGQLKKIRQIGNVVIEDDVEIGANVVIDRASMGSTIIRAGAKLDNLIQIAHNVEIGKNTAMAAQSGVAGSTKIGPGSLIGGQAGIVGHIEIGANAEIQAQSGVTASTEAGAKLYGSPALDYVSYLRSYAMFRNLPTLSAAVRDLQKRIDELENRL